MAGLSFNIFGHDVSASRSLQRVGDQAGHTASRIREHFKGLATVVAGAFAANFLGDSIHAASDLNETISKSAQIFGKNADAVKAWSSTAATNLGLSQQAALDSASSFGDMFSQLGFAGNAAAGMSEKVVKMAADLGSFNNLPTDQVLDMLSGAFRGEYDSLQRVIPNISAARVETEALNETHKASAKELTAAEKAQATLAIVMKDGKRATGDFARTSGGLANQQKIMAAQVKDAQAKLGTLLLPILAKLAAFLTGTVIPAVTALGHWIGKNKDWLIPLVAAVASAVVVWRTFTAVQAALNLVMEANPFVLIATLIAALVAGLIVAWKKSETFRDIVKGVWNTIKRVVQGAWDNVLRPVLNALKAAWGFVADAARSMWHGIQNVFGWLKDGIRTVRDVVHAVVGRIGDFLGSVASAARTMWSGVSTVYGWLKDGIRRVRDVIKAVVGGIGKAFGAIGTGLTWVWNHSIGPILDFIKGGIQDVIDLMNSLTNFGAGVDFKVKNPNNVFDTGHNAQGTGFWRGGATWVGEHGPELVRLPRGSQVDPTSQALSLAGRGGGGDVNITVQVTGSVLSERDLMSVIERQAKQGVKIRAAKAFI